MQSKYFLWRRVLSEDDWWRQIPSIPFPSSQNYFQFRIKSIKTWNPFRLEVTVRPESYKTYMLCSDAEKSCLFFIYDVADQR